MWKNRLAAAGILIIGVGLGLYVYKSEPVGGHAPLRPNILTGYFERHQKPFTLGLDLSGGTHLVYEADVSEIPEDQIDDSMQVLRDVVLRRINTKQVAGSLGVLEPLVQVKEGGIGASGSQQLVVDLPGVTDVAAAEATIGQTPTLEFRLRDEKAETFVSTGLTGRYLSSSRVEFDPTTGAAHVALQFNEEGSDLFSKITRENVGETLAIFLDGAMISAPTIEQEITGGQAVISGTFTPKQAKDLAGSLSYGALPVPISLVSSELIGPSLGQEALDAGLFAGLVGFIAIAAFLVLWYRLPGLIATVALAIYAVVTLLLFKLMHVTLSSAAIAGFIISVGMAVDANVLIFERVKEELRAGRRVADAIADGFSRAWLSIRDSNVSSMITALILFFVFKTSFIRGFAITFLLGVLVSMLSAIVVSRVFLRAASPRRSGRLTAFLFGSGFSSAGARKS